MFNLKVTLSVFLESYPKFNFCGAAILYLKLVGLIVTDGTNIGTTFSKFIKTVVGSATSKVNSSAFTLSNPLASSSTILPFSI